MSPEQPVHGWFNFSWLYDWAARNCGLSARTPTFIEVGVWQGASLIHLCKALRAAGRRSARVLAVDTWSMEPAGPANDLQNVELARLKAAGRDLYEVYRRNIDAAGIGHMVIDVMMPSVMAAKFVGPADFVFLDADHSSSAVVEDVEAWRPKAAVLAGHDVCEPSVYRGLCRALGPENFYTIPILNCWTVHEPLARAMCDRFDVIAGDLVTRIKQSYQECSHG